MSWNGLIQDPPRNKVAPGDRGFHDLWAAHHGGTLAEVLASEFARLDGYDVNGEPEAAPDAKLPKR